MDLARQHSASAASCSGRCAPVVHHPKALLKSNRLQSQLKCPIKVSRPTKCASFGSNYTNTYRVERRENVEPDFTDPNWEENVTDWYEFWNYARWNDEVNELGESTDAGGNDLYSGERLFTMIDEIEHLKKSNENISITPPQDFKDHDDYWEKPPVDPWVPQDVNPILGVYDVRAISEKTKKKAFMEAEWQRRKSFVGKLVYPDPYQDARLRKYDWQYREWTEEEVYNLITNNGINCKPETHQGIVESPLVPVDHVNVLGIKYLEETEDFLERIGHLASPEEEEYLTDELVVDLQELGWSMPDEYDEEDAVHDDEWVHDEDEDGQLVEDM